ncbi:hypothetical protein Y1Q_0007256 [Alligator mississippiensis]|uniref:SAP domain-containing protein n=1 Tax=Alligator mississippiensis TaxID=8496 RepID=A0A151NMX0_ALLMI|nr:hypothetical protein Y1Q_0007256 [Alligator mississippiensis]
MADEYDHLTVANLRELMKERGLPVRKEQKREDLIKILCDNDQAARSPLAVHTEPMGGTEGPPSEWEFQKFQLQLEAEERNHKLKHELELKRMELEAQHQCEHKAREVQHEHEKE